MINMSISRRRVGRFQERIIDFSYNHSFIFGIMKTFFMMVIICVSVIIGLLPICFCIGANGWWILSAFIIWPVGFNSIGWIVRYFDV